MIVFDATFLLLLVDPDADPPTDPATGKPVTHAKARIEHLLLELNKSGERVGVPTPALAEILVGARGSIADLVAALTSSYKLKLLPFDELAAIEVALMTDKDALGSKGLTDETKAKVKYDRQIIAIAKVASSDAIYSDDGKLREKAQSLGIHALGLNDVTPPPETAQGSLPLADSSEQPNDGGERGD